MDEQQAGEDELLEGDNHEPRKRGGKSRKRVSAASAKVKRLVRYLIHLNWTRQAHGQVKAIIHAPGLQKRFVQKLGVCMHDCHPTMAKALGNSKA